MSRLKRQRRTSVALALVLAMGLLAAGCLGKQDTPRAQASSTKPSASASALVSRYTMDQLATRPCLALDAHDRAALGIAGPGKQDQGGNGAACEWEINGQTVTLELNVPESDAKTFATGGRVTQVPVGQHSAVQVEFQRICFIFVAVHDVDHLVDATAIPKPGSPQEGACPAAASIAAATLTHIE